MTATLDGKDLSISRSSFEDVVTVSVDLGCEDMAIAAYNDSGTPSVLITRDKFQNDTSTNQKIEFRTIYFKDFRGYRVWCCEINGDELRACLVR